jgi:gamma-glutamyltranspeptidase/glutathione hydrolase
MAPLARLLLLQQLAAPPLPHPSPSGLAPPSDFAQTPGRAQHHAPAAAATPRRGAVATENARCSRIGADALLAGGSAADAAVAAVLCVGVVGMYHAGIGGGGFLLVRAPGAGAAAAFEHVDFREAAPAAASRRMFDGPPPRRSVVGGLAAGVPGELRGLALLHARHGRLPWRDLVMPAVRLARGGWEVGADLERYMALATLRSAFLTEDPEWARDFAPAGRLLRAGERISRPRYADTLETVAREGAGTFYEGPLAEATVRALRKAGGIMTAEDLREYEAVVRKPVEMTYRGHRLVSCGAPASGSVVLAALGVVQGYGDFGWAEARNLSTHRLDEAVRFAYGLVSCEPWVLAVLLTSEADEAGRSVVCRGDGRLRGLHDQRDHGGGVEGPHHR